MKCDEYSARSVQLRQELGVAGRRHDEIVYERCGAEPCAFAEEIETLAADNPIFFRFLLILFYLSSED